MKQEKSELELCQQEQRRLRQSLHNTISELKRSDEMLNGYISNAAECERERKRLQTDHTLLITRFNELQERYQQKNNEIKSYQAVIASQDKEIAALKEDLAHYKEQVEIYANGLVNSMDSVEELQAQLSTKAPTDWKEEQIKSLQKQIAETEAHAYCKGYEKATLKMKEHYEEIIIALEEKLAQLSGQQQPTTEGEQCTEDLKEKINELVKQNLEWKYECERLSGVATHWAQKYHEVCPPHQNPKIDNL